LEIALACDLIVAARGARLGIPEVKRSLVAAGGALIRLPKRNPYHVAMELALTGDPVPAERGYEIGMVNRLAEPGARGATARELAAAIARNGPLALDATKRILQSAPDWARRRGVGAPGRDRRARVRLRRRERGRHRLRGEARSRVARALNPVAAGRLLAEERDDDPARSAAIAVLAEVDPLPGAERKAAVADRQRQRRAHQRRLDVRRHVVGALVDVGPVVRVLGTATSAQDSKSRRTSGEAFSLSVSEADVCCMSRCSRPTRTSPSSGTAPGSRA
jgi:hypothetical protein